MGRETRSRERHPRALDQLIEAAVFDRHGRGWRAIALTADEILLGYTLMTCGDCAPTGGRPEAAGGRGSGIDRGGVAPVSYTL
jgi:hypothetical protein